MAAPTRKRDRTRAQLLEAALTLFAQLGYEATTIDQIASAAGVARQTVLNHFPRKEEFVLAWGARRRDQVAAELGAAGPDGVARDRLREVYRTLAAINEGERELTSALHLPYQAITAERPVPEVVVHEISAAQQRGEFEPSLDPQAAGEVLTAVYFDTLSRWLLADAGSLTAALERKLDIVLAGFLVSTPARSDGAGSSPPRGRRSATTRPRTRATRPPA